MIKNNDVLTVVGGGLAGCEAAWQAAQRGMKVRLYEMRPVTGTPAHDTDKLAELVCSNSLGSAIRDRATGVLQYEMRRLGSLLLKCADEARVPAGGALAVGREAFADAVTSTIEAHPLIEVVREEVTDIPKGPSVLASGPLTSDALSEAISSLTGSDHLYFYDALAPIVRRDSIDMTLAFQASRYDRGEREEGDYINCPLNREEYETFLDALLLAERIPLKSFEAAIESGVKSGLHFEGCLPVEVIASRGRESLAFGPMRPVGLRDPRSGRRATGIVQLRQDDVAGELYNLVGFQTNMKYSEQQRVFSLIPGLGHAEFVRYGQMHRNTFLNAPSLLGADLALKKQENLFVAGQLAGIEGYAGNIASGWLAGVNAIRKMQGRDLLKLPRETMLGALLYYIANAEAKNFQPMKANMGILPPLASPEKGRRGKRERAALYAERAAKSLETFIHEAEDDHIAKEKIKD